MNDAEALAKAQWLIARSGQTWDKQLNIANFREFCNAAADAVRYGMSVKQREALPWLTDWAERFSAIHGDFETKIRRNPPLAYQARTPKHQAFHDSTAFIRYSPAGNGCGKTDMAYIEDLWCATGQQHWTGQRGNVVVVSTGHAGYSEKVFTVKFIQGEDGDPLTPMVPENGYYYHSYDQRKYLLRIACEDCAEAGRPKECTHTKSIHCLSADSSMERLMGFTARLAHLDEFVPADIYREMLQRIRRGNVRGRMIVTGTPLLGPDTWMQRDLLDLARKRPDDNWTDKIARTERYVEVFPISKYDCVGTPGGPTLGQIEAEKANLPPSEYRARVLGEAVPLGDSLFDLAILDAIEKDEGGEPEYGQIALADASIEDLEWSDSLIWEPEVWKSEDQYEGFRVWEHPKEGCQYVMGCDSAAGVGSKEKDASSSYVFKIVPSDGDMKLEMVAAHYSYLDVYAYAKEVKKLAIYYNQALVVPETTGIGATLMTSLSRHLFYPALFLGDNKGEAVAAAPDSNFGVNTGAQTKPLMISALHAYISKRKMIIRDKEAISECRTFQRERSESGLSWRYGAATGAHDDRVISMALVAYAAANHPDQVFTFSLSPTKKPKGDGGGTPGPQPKPRGWIC